MRKSLLGLACGILGGISAFFLIFLFFSPKIAPKVVEFACEGNCADADTIQIAMQLGRLDVIALALTFLGILLATLAVFGFVAIREKAVLQARDAAEDAIRNWVGVEGSKRLGQEVSKLLEIYEEQMSDNRVDAIMKAFADSPKDGGD